jgi:hypothetical protein
MGPAAGVYDVDLADPAIIGGIGVGLQYPFEFIQEAGRAFAPAARAKL